MSWRAMKGWSEAEKHTQNTQNPLTPRSFEVFEYEKPEADGYGLLISTLQSVEAMAERQPPGVRIAIANVLAASGGRISEAFLSGDVDRIRLALRRLMVDARARFM
jgi:hypothetical protein